ncbi:MAG TPA: hypothetical protein VFX30_10265, partial [bacterium]|nr:hypothetical protein [bacterium]
ADKIQNAYNTLKNDHLGLDDDHYGIVMESLKRALGIPPTQNHTGDLIGVGITFLLVGIGTGILGFAAKAIWDRISKGPKDPKDGPGGKGGGGGSGGGSKPLPSIPVNEIPAGAQLSGGFVVVNGQPIGVAVMKRAVTSETVAEGQVVSGEIDTNAGDKTQITVVPDFGINWDEEPTREWVALPDGVVPLDEGAFIYRYQATINGEIVGLNETVARNLAAARGEAYDPNAFIFAGDFTYDQFMNVAAPAPMVLAAPVDTAAAYRALVANNVSVNYGALGYARSTNTAVAGAPNAVAPGFKPVAVPLTFGGAGATTAFRMPSLALKPALVPAR